VVQDVKVVNEQGVATQFGLESCVGGGNSAGEALTEGGVGRVLSREIDVQLRGAGLAAGRGAEPVGGRRRPHLVERYREPRQDPARSETPCMRSSIAYGNREIPRLTEGGTSVRKGAGPSGFGGRR